MENLEDNVGGACTLIDHTKAFDTVDLKILLEKSELYGLRGKVFNLLRSYLENRKQNVSCNNSLSDTKTIYFYVPKGSVLGPLLFLLHKKDVPNVKSYCLVMIA